MTLSTLCIFVAIVFERFAWYLFLGELEEWRGPQAVGDLMAMAYLLPLLQLRRLPGDLFRPGDELLLEQTNRRRVDIAADPIGNRLPGALRRRRQGGDDVRRQ